MRRVGGRLASRSSPVAALAAPPLVTGWRPNRRRLCPGLLLIGPAARPLLDTTAALPLFEQASLSKAVAQRFFLPHLPTLPRGALRSAQHFACCEHWFSRVLPTERQQVSASIPQPVCQRG